MIHCNTAKLVFASNMNLQESFQAIKDVQHDDLLTSEYMSPLDLFIRELDERKGKIPCCQEVTDIQRSVENVLKDLLLGVERENPFFKTTLINSGSFYEGTKVGQPDEFDYFVQLDYFSEPDAVVFDELPRSIVMVTPSELSIKKLLKLTPSKFNHYFCIDKDFHWKTWIKAPFVEIFSDKAKGFEAYGMKVLSRALARHGPAYCLELIWTGGERYRGLKISVDLSLAVKINTRSLTLDVDLEGPTGVVIKSCLDSLPYFFAVSAYRDREFEAPLGCVDRFRLRCSQSCLEQALFRHFGPDSGQSVCLRALKVLRDISFLGDDDIDMFRDESIADFKWIPVSLTNVPFFDPQLNLLKVRLEVLPLMVKSKLFSKWISSYALKTLVLFEWKQNPAEEQWAGSNLNERLFNILNTLRLCLNQGGLRSFFYNDYNVLPNEDDENFKIHPVNRVTILHHCILSIRNATEYRFEDCLENILQEVKLTCQKMILTQFLCQGLECLCNQELNKVIARTTNKKKDFLMFFEKFVFCDIYIQALLSKIAPEEKLILIDLKQLNNPQASLRKAVELFKDIAGKRMKGLENLPSYNLWSQEFRSASNEIAKLLEVLFNAFKKDIEILLTNLSNIDLSNLKGALSQALTDF